MQERIVSIPNVFPSRVSTACLLDTEGDAFSEVWDTNYRLSAADDIKLPHRCLYPDIAEDLDHREFPEAFTTEYSFLAAIDAVVTVIERS